MELQMQMMMDPSSGTLNGGATMWLGHSPDSSPQPPAPPPPYHRHLSPNRQDERIIVSAQQLDDDESSMKLWLYQASMGFHESTCHGVLWHEKRDLPKHSVDGNLGQLRINNRDESLSTKHSAASFHQSSTTNGLKRRAVCESHQQMPELLDRKHARRDGSVGSNGSVGHAGWSTQVEELAEHLAADFDGPLSALAASDLANAVASYNMSEALLALPSLTVFKQEAPSPDNQTSNSNLNHVSQRNTSQNSNNGGVCTPGNEADSDNNNDTNRNNEQRGFNGVGAVPNLISSINGGSTATITPNINSSSRTSGVAAAAAATTVNQQNHRNKNHGSRNNEQTDGNNLHQLLCSNGDDYPPVNSSSGNPHVSSSQQGNEFNEDSRFQYVLAAATSIATKLNEETLTYLNQGQSYEIKLKKLGDLSAYRGKILKSNIRICFHERRLQYTEREQMLAWQRARPGERLLEVDVPLSYGMLDVSQLSASKNSIEFMWDPTKEVGVYIKVNCISTEFTPKKHGGEKGVPFRILVETRLPGGPRLHAASCQVKVFKLKGADRKHKQDRDKILRRPPHEQDKYQPSYDCTVLSDIPLDSLSSSSPINKKNEGNLFGSTDTTSPHENHAAVIVNCGRGDDDNGDDGTSSSVAQAAIPLSLGGGSSVVSFINTLEREKERDDGCTNTAESSNVCATSSTATSTIVRASFASRLPAPVVTSLSNVAVAADSGDGVEATFELSANANVAQTNAWLRARRFQPFQNTFASFSAEDILRLSRDDLIQICGLADGIRLFNALHSKAPTPKLTLYFAMEGNSAVPWRVIYMENLNSTLFTSKLLTTLNLPHDRLQSILIQGPHGVHVLVSNELVANIKNESMYLVEIIKDCSSERYKLLLKPSMLPQAPLSTTPSPPPPPQR